MSVEDLLVGDRARTRGGKRGRGRRRRRGLLAAHERHDGERERVRRRVVAGGLERRRRRRDVVVLYMRARQRRELEVLEGPEERRAGAGPAAAAQRVGDDGGARLRGRRAVEARHEVDGRRVAAPRHVAALPQLVVVERREHGVADEGPVGDLGRRRVVEEPLQERLARRGVPVPQQPAREGM